MQSQRDLFDIPHHVCYMNAAAWSPLPTGGVETGRRGAALKARPWELPAGYDAGQFERARDAAAGLINASPDDVALISSVGYGVSTAAKVFEMPAGSRVLVLDSDHTAPVLEWMERSGAGGFDVEPVKRGPDGDWTSSLLEAIERQGAKPVSMASISSVHWSDGGQIDLARIRPALRAHGAGLLVDATHAAGVIPIDVAELDPDFLIFPTYKWLLGPYGRAFIYIAKRHQQGIPLEQTSYGRKRVVAEDQRYFTDLDYVGTARRFDMGERDFFVSLGVASHGIELVRSLGPARISERLRSLTNRISDGLSEHNLPVSMLAPHLRAPNLLCLDFADGMPDDLAQQLARRDVYAAVRLGRLRISPHVYNDEADCDRLVEALSSILH